MLSMVPRYKSKRYHGISVANILLAFVIGHRVGESVLSFIGAIEPKNV